MSKSVKFSSKIEAGLLEELRGYAEQEKKNISTLFNEAVAEYLAKVKVRPVFLKSVNRVIEKNKELLERLAK